MATVDEGDEVVIPVPCWAAYTLMTQLVGGTPVHVSCPQNNGFRLRPEDLEAAITPRTRWLLLNYPNNPTGAVASRAELAGLAEVLLRHPQVWVMADDMYEHLYYSEERYATLAEVEPRLKDRTLTVSGVSKTYAMTGWRIGFAGGPKDLIRAMVSMQGHAAAGVSTIGQAAAVGALDGPQELVAERAATEAAVVVVSPAGPMTRSELELVQGLGDPLTLADFLPREPVAKGRPWKLPESAVVALTGYDALKSSTMEATLEQLDEAAARIRLKGEVQGSALGGAGTITCEGFLNFDRKAGLVDRLEVNRVENRQPGPVEAGLDVKSTLTVLRRPARLAQRADLVPQVLQPRREQGNLGGFSTAFGSFERNE